MILNGHYTVYCANYWFFWSAPRNFRDDRPTLCRHQNCSVCCAVNSFGQWNYADICGGGGSVKRQWNDAMYRFAVLSVAVYLDALVTRPKSLYGNIIIIALISVSGKRANKYPLMALTSHFTLNSV